MPYLLSIDIGGTKIAVAAVSVHGDILARSEIETRAAEGAPHVIARLSSTLHSLERDEELLGIGIGCTGPVDPRTGHVMNPYTLPTWDDVDIVTPLAQEFQVPVILENDCDAAALGEFWRGAARGAHNVVYVTVGTGIGSGLIFNGRLYRGVGMVVGEFGHMTIDHDGPPCYCGSRGCLEILAAGPAIATAYQQRTDGGDISARQVVELARNGDADAQAVIEQTAYYLGVGLSNLITLLAPDVIVLGGGVMEHFELFEPGICKTIETNVKMVPWRDSRITRAALGASAGVVGAAKAALERMSDPMTPLERYLAVCNGELPDRAPVSPFIMQFAAKVAGVSYRDYCLSGEVMAHAQMTCARRFGYDSVNVTSDAVREYQALGGPVADFGEESVPAAEPEPFIKDEDDLRRLRLPDPLGDNPMHEQITALRILLKEMPEQPVYAWVEAPFQESCILRDINHFMVDLRTNPELPKEILKFVVEMETDFACAQIEAGAQFIGIGDAIASLGSASDYAEFNFPYLSELVNRIKARGAYIKYHACGRTKHIWQYLKQLDIDILNLDSLIDFGEAREFFGDKFVLKGNLNPITEMMDATPEIVHAASQRSFAQAGTHGKFILSPGCELPPQTPYENLEALVESSRLYCSYSKENTDAKR